jgi:hypothetical protein
MPQVAFGNGKANFSHEAGMGLRQMPRTGSWATLLTKKIVRFFRKHAEICRPLIFWRLAGKR